MINLNDRYYIKFEPMNIILCEKKELGAKSKRQGEFEFEPIGYYGNFDSLLNGLLKKYILDDSGSIIDSFVKLNDEINKFKSEIISKMEEIEND